MEGNKKVVDDTPVNKTFSPKKIHPFLSSKFKRRNPLDYFYVPIECPLGRQCNNGLCPFSHTKLEVIFHPILHKSKKCRMALLNVCNFSIRCAFYHNTVDKIDAYLKWLEWKRKWSVWDDNMESVLANYELGADVSKKICSMMRNRDQTNTDTDNNSNSDDSMSYLEKELHNILNSDYENNKDLTGFKNNNYIFQNSDLQLNLLSYD